MSKKTKKTFISEAEAKHGVGRYDYSTLDFVNYETPVLITCTECKTRFSQRPRGHIRAESPCPVCRGSLKHKTIVSLSDEDGVRQRDRDYFFHFRDIASKKHRNKYRYKYAGVTDVKLLCPDHGAHLINKKLHIGGQGCPQCM